MFVFIYVSQNISRPYIKIYLYRYIYSRQRRNRESNLSLLHPKAPRETPIQELCGNATDKIRRLSQERRYTYTYI